MAKSVVLDANLLVLLVAGNTDNSLIERHKNLSAYDAASRLDPEYVNGDLQSLETNR
jgi:hypothetical protein